MTIAIKMSYSEGKVMHFRNSEVSRYIRNILKKKMRASSEAEFGLT